MAEDFEDAFDDSVNAGASSLYAELKARREKATEELFFDYPVPKLEPLHVRYRPMTGGEVKATAKAAERNKKRDDGEVLAQAGLLARCCLGVFDVDENGNAIGDPDEWLRFGPELAEVLGVTVDRPRAADVVRALYVRDGDITSTFNQLVVDSGYVLSELEESEAGN
jgi:hypothetical protein